MEALRRPHGRRPARRGGIAVIDEKELEEMRARADAASPGPWAAKHEEHDLVGAHESWVEFARGRSRSIFLNLRRFFDGCPVPGATEHLEQASRDAEFIAHAREDVPRLLDEVERLRALVRGLEMDAGEGT